MLTDETKHNIQRDYFTALVKASDEAADRLIDAGISEADAYNVLLQWDVMGVALLVHVLDTAMGDSTSIGKQTIEHLKTLIDQDELDWPEGLPKRQVVL
jgi:ABC-type transporter Mla MlaB component